ncbi:hypothetical protein DBR23_08390 [Acidovorax sp. HMWF018]|nr:hypothetical protein DBR23_08390 [Acidovorax sp. HMWF018]
MICGHCQGLLLHLRITFDPSQWWTLISVALDARCWTIPKERMKAGREHTVPLSDAAVRVLQAAAKLRNSDAQPSGLIFKNLQGHALSDMTFTQLLRRMGYDFTVHGFRASFRTWGADIAHYEHEMLEVALSHVVGDATVRAYHRSDMVEKRRKLMDEWAAYLAQTVEEGENKSEEKA